MAHFNKRHYEAIALVIQDLTISDDEHDPNGIDELEARRAAIAGEFADMLARDNSLFNRNRFLHACKPGSNVKAKTAHLKQPYQPKTGAACSCRRGVERDNCPRCEGTGMVIDFAAIRAR